MTESSSLARIADADLAIPVVEIERDFADSGSLVARATEQLGGIGFFLSRMFGTKFDALRTATDSIREGDLRVDIQAAGRSRLSDEMDDLDSSDSIEETDGTDEPASDDAI